MPLMTDREQAACIVDMLITALVRIEVYNIGVRQEVIKLIASHSEDANEPRINKVLEVVKVHTLETASEYGEVL